MEKKKQIELDNFVEVTIFVEKGKSLSLKVPIHWNHEYARWTGYIKTSKAKTFIHSCGQTPNEFKKNFTSVVQKMCEDPKIKEELIEMFEKK